MGSGQENVRTRNQTRRRPTLRIRRKTMFAVIGVDQPIEKIVNDWDFLEDQIVKKFVAWQSVGGNLMGIRRRHITLQEVIDPKKGKFNSISLTPDGIVSK